MNNILHRKKWTTIFILITLAICCLILSFTMLSRSSSSEGRTYVLLGYIKSDLELCWLNKGKLPDSNSASNLIRAFNDVSPTDYTSFIDINTNVFVDGWGNPLIINRIGRDQFQFRSLGADKVSNTKDDITDHWSITKKQIPKQ